MLDVLATIGMCIGAVLLLGWIFGVAVEFFTGVRIEWRFLLWGMFHRKEIAEASICQCHKPGAEWTPAVDPNGRITMLCCWYCGRVASPAEFHEIMAARKGGSLATSTPLRPN